MEQLQRLRKSLTKNLTSYDLFAITVLIMIFGHAIFYFYPEDNYLRIPDRIFVPVFLISIGYNAGRKPGNLIIFGAIAMTYTNFIITGEIHGDILLTIVLTKYLVPHIAKIVTTSKTHFWAVFLILFTLIPLSQHVTDYGTIAIIMALAGWINKNRSAMPEEIISPSNYFILAFGSFLFSVHHIYKFNVLEMLFIGFFTSFIFLILYDFKILLLNAIKRRPKDPIEKLCSFLGHKSLEIYMVHMLIFQVILVMAVLGVIG